MFNAHKIWIYKGMIQYLLDRSGYSLSRIANLSNSSLTHLQLIYHHSHLPKENKLELNLLKIFITYVELEHKSNLKTYGQEIWGINNANY